jgi:two-component system OmpR family sensor kinase
MSSSPPTDVPSRTDVSESPKARWRDPAGWSLRARLVATMIALLAVLGLVVGTTAELFLHRTLYDQVDSKLNDAAGRTLREFGYQPGGAPGNPNNQVNGIACRAAARSNPPSGNPGGGPASGQPENTLMVCLSGSGIKGGILRERQTTWNREYDTLPSGVTATLQALPTDRSHRTADLGELGDYRLTARAMSDGSVVLTGLPLKDAQAILLQVAGLVAGVTLFALLVAGFAGAVIVRRTLKPLSRVAATATKVSELTLDRGAVDLAQRVPETDTDLRTEVGQVGAALNRMLDHVGNALEARQASEMQVRQFVADASHELRTPLAAIRGYAELSRRSRSPVPDEVAHVLRRVESEAQRMTALVEDLLLLARLDAGRPLALDPVDLTMLVVDAVSDAHAAGPRHDWQLALPAEPVLVTGDDARLHQILTNLLANARTHTPEGTTVTVGVGAEGPDAVLRVSDRGPGIPEALLPHIFERFARGDSSRSRAAGSTGLGLSIVHAVVTAHHGWVSVQSSAQGTTFEVRLPMVAQPSGGPDAVEQDVPEFVQ